MSFWTRVLGIDGIRANLNPPTSVGEPDWNPGHPDGFELVGWDESTENRSLPFVQPSPWSGWPADWSTPNFQIQAAQNRLIDIAWACLDMASNVVSAMPVYRLRGGQIIEPTEWMTNPDPTVYTCWQEFAKELFWDYQMGEAFVFPMLMGSDGKPSRFRVIPPWLVSVELGRGGREYKLGNVDVTDRILHIRYKSNIADPRGHGPLEVAGARQTAIGLLQRYANNIAETGGVPEYWIGVNRVLRSKSEATDLLDTWIETRSKYAGHPAVLGSGATLNQAHSMSARDMTLMELSQFNESRIAVLLGTPPFLVGLAGATGSLTYSNISDLFDFHDRSSLRPKVRMLMKSLSGWALPRGQECELNRDDYTRLPMDKRALAYKTLWEIKALSSDEIRDLERYLGGPATQALSGRTQISDDSGGPAGPSPDQGTSTTSANSNGRPPPSNRQVHKHANIGGIRQ